MTKKEIEEQLKSLPETKLPNSLAVGAITGSLSGLAGYMQMPDKKLKGTAAVALGTTGALLGIAATKLYNYRRKQINNGVKREVLKQIYNDKYGNADDIKPTKKEDILNKLLTLRDVMRF